MSRSVAPTEGLSAGNGPPSVVRKIALKLLKLNANEAISSGVSATSSSGRVTRRKLCQAEAPSIDAASVRSRGIACRAPVATRNMYGYPSQSWTRITAKRAVHGCPSQSTDNPKSRLISPKSALNMSRHTSSIGYALRPRTRSECRASAQSSPSVNWTSTEPSANPMVQVSVPKNGLATLGSVTTRLKLLRPTLTRQPCGSRSPALSTKDPAAPSAVQTCPVAVSVTQSQPASYLRVACPSYARDSPDERIAPFAVGTANSVISLLRALASPRLSRL